MTASLTREEVAKTALLARLKLSGDELDQLTTELAGVLQYVEILGEVNTDDVEPMAHAVERVNVLRDDVLEKSLPRKPALANAPKTDGQSFLVPPILENA